MPDEQGLGAVRRLLQDLIAPAVGRVEERVGGLAGECVRLGQELEKNREGIKELWQALGDQRDRLARIEGRFDSVKEELVAKVELEALRRFSSRRGPKKLPDPDDG